jgi:phage FluMu protein Com
VITVSLSGLFVIYLLSFLAMILALWIVYEFRRKAGQVEPSEQRIYRCTICTHVYLDDRDEAFSRCPRCGSLNDVTSTTGRLVRRRRGRGRGRRRGRRSVGAG